MMTLEAARRLAGTIGDAVAPFCDRLELAGSVRRQRPYVNDLDFVCILRPANRPAFMERATLRAALVKDGDDIVIIRLPGGQQIDFYFAHNGKKDLLEAQPSNWGSVLLSRTGSKEHNILLADRARKLGLKWETMIGVTKAGADGTRTILASESEQAIFQALEMNYVAPESREVQPAAWSEPMRPNYRGD